MQHSPSYLPEDILTEDPLFELAPRRRRWKAAMLDYFMFVVLVFVFIRFGGNFIPGLWIFIIPWLILLPLMEAFTRGQTLGKWVYRMRSAKPDGSKIEVTQALTRHLLDVVDFLPVLGIVGLTVAANNRRQQRVGDLVAKTIVIKA
jgi:uncharacterized RDD family membrane protein YckC